MHTASRLAAVLAIALAAMVSLAASAGAATISSFTPTPLADNFADDGVCSLREMVQIANTDNAAVEDICDVSGAPLGDDTIQLQVGTYTLSGAAGENLNATGDLDVSDNTPNTLTIIGQGRDATSIDGADLDRILQVIAPAGTLELVDLTVQNGQVTGASGGGILSAAGVTLDGARVTGNTTVTSGNGGGIQIGPGNRTVNMLSGSSVDTNVAAGTGGGIDLGNGGSLATTGDDIEISHNAAGSEGGGVNLSLGSGTINLGAGTLLEDNHALAQGGAISSTTGGALTVTGATIRDNGVTENVAELAQGGGIHWVGGVGGLQLTDTTVDNNTAVGNEATGGGLNINALAGGVSLVRTTVINNEVTVTDDADGATFEGGGGITLTGVSPTTITDSLVAANAAIVNDDEDTAAGAGIFDSGALTINRSTVQGNDLSLSNAGGRSGAGLRGVIPAGPTRILNSTFSGNTMAGSGVGGGIAVNVASHPLTVAHSTFALNNAGFGDAINISGGTDATIRGSLIDEGSNGCFPDGMLGIVNGFNVDAGTSCVGSNFDTDLGNATTNLGPLADNGGPTQTHALLIGPDSQAINFVPAAQCLDLANAPLTVDQRGRARPFPGVAGAPCDAGAYELGDIDGDGIFDTFDQCPTQFGPPPGCPVPSTATPPPADAGPTGQRAAALKKCKKKKTKKAKKKCRKRAKRLPV